MMMRLKLFSLCFSLLVLTSAYTQVQTDPGHGLPLADEQLDSKACLSLATRLENMEKKLISIKADEQYKYAAFTKYLKDLELRLSIEALDKTNLRRYHLGPNVFHFNPCGCDEKILLEIILDEYRMLASKGYRKCKKEFLNRKEQVDNIELLERIMKYYGK